MGIDKPRPSLADCMAAAQASQPPPTPLHPPPALMPQPPPPPPQSAAPLAVSPACGLSNGKPLQLDIPPGTGHTFLPSDLELEAVSPDSDKLNRSCGSGSDASGDDTLQTEPQSGTALSVAVVGSNMPVTVSSFNRSASGVGEDFESPAFEPLEGRSSSALSNRPDDADEDGDNSKLSAISGLTSRDSVESNRSGAEQMAAKIPNESFSSAFDEDEANRANETKLIDVDMTAPRTAVEDEDCRPHIAGDLSAVAQMDMDESGATPQCSENVSIQLMPAHSQHDHSSELSQVSSNSRLSMTTDRESPSGGPPDEHGDEAQMPRFNDNSSNSHNANAATAHDEHDDRDTDNTLATGPTIAADTARAMLAPSIDQPSKSVRPLQTSFGDIKQDEIMFEGTRRHSICVDIKAESAAAQPHAPEEAPMPIDSPPPLPLLPPPPPAVDALQPPFMPLEAPTVVPSQIVSVLASPNGSAGCGGKQSISMSMSSCSSSASSMSSSNLIIAETRSLTLNDDDEENETNAAVMEQPIDSNDTIQQTVPVEHLGNEGPFKAPSPITVDSAIDGKHVKKIDEPATATKDNFKFETPNVDSSDSRDKSRDSSAHKSSRHRDAHSRSHHSSTASRSSSSQRARKSSSSATGDKDKEKNSSHRSSSSTSSSSRHDGHSHSGSSSSRGKDKRDSSKDTKESKETGDKTKDHKESSFSHRSSSHSSKSASRSSSSSTHRSSSHRNSSSTKDKERSRHGDSKSSSSSSSSRSSTAHHAKLTNTTDNMCSPRESKSQSPRVDDEDDAVEACNQRGIERRRSNDHDSNDGQPPAPGAGANEVAAVVRTTTAAAKEDNQQVPADGRPVTECSSLAASALVHSKVVDEIGLRSPPPLPVLVDQILTGAQPSDIDLERLIALCASASGAAAEDPALSSIQQTIASTSTTSGIKRPMLASNIHEARKLSKVRKQMDRDEQKRFEQAVVLAKQYLSRNASTLGDQGQGVELEFACVTQAPNAGPSISSPVSPIKPVDTRPKDEIGGTDDVDFIGFPVNTAPMEQDVVEDNDSSDGDFYGFDLADCQQSAYAKAFQLARTNSQSVCLTAPNAASTYISRPARNVRRPKSQSESCVAAAIGCRRASKRHSPDAGGREDVPVLNGFRPRRIKIDAHIQMVKAGGSGGTTTGSDDMMTDDDVHSIDSTSTSVGGVLKRSAGGAASTSLAAQMTDSADGESMDDGGSQLSDVQSSASTHVSPTPSDQSAGSKENNFVPKIKKAVSRSLAHNSSMLLESPGSSSASPQGALPTSPSTSSKCKK